MARIVISLHFFVSYSYYAATHSSAIGFINLREFLLKDVITSVVVVSGVSYTSAFDNLVNKA